MLDWWLPENVSTYGREIDWLFHLIYAITGVTFILVAAALIAFLIMYRDGRAAGRGTRTATRRSRSCGPSCRR